MKELRKVEAQLEQTSQALEQAVRKAEGDKMEALMMEAENKNDDVHASKHAKKKRKDKLNKALGTNRGIETMFRSAYRVQMDLTGLADNKANMMISINGIIISIIIASVAPKLDANPWLLIPTTVFLLGNLVSIVYAIMAARPASAAYPSPWKT